MAMIAELFGFFLENPDRLPPATPSRRRGEPRAPGGVRLHRRNDGWVLPPHLRADDSAERLVSTVVKLDSSASCTP